MLTIAFTCCSTTALAITIGQSIESSDRMHRDASVVRTALSAAFQRIQALQCDVAYDREKWIAARGSIAVERFDGTLTWRGPEAAWTLFEGDSRIRKVDAICSSAQLAVYYLLPNGAPTFSFQTRPSSVDQWTYDERRQFTYLHPAVFFAGWLREVVEGTFGIKECNLNESKRGLELLVVVGNGGKIEATLSLAHDLLPVSFRSFYLSKGEHHLGTEQEFEWTRDAKTRILLPKRFKQFEVGKIDGAVRRIGSEVRFANLQVNAAIDSNRFLVAKLPIPEGTTGVSRDSRPYRIIEKRNGQFVASSNNRTARPTPKAAPAGELNFDLSDREADRARAARRRYYIDKTVNALAIAATLAAIVAGTLYVRRRIAR